MLHLLTLATRQLTAHSSHQWSDVLAVPGMSKGIGVFDRLLSINGGLLYGIALAISALRHPNKHSGEYRFKSTLLRLG